MDWHGMAQQSLFVLKSIPSAALVPLQAEQLTLTAVCSLQFALFQSHP